MSSVQPLLSGTDGITAAEATTIANAAVARSTTAAIPVQIITADYTAQATDQRFLHASSSNHVLTLMDVQSVYERVFLVLNDGPGQFAIVDAVGNVLATLGAQQTIQFLATFVLGGQTASPSDFEVNGQPSSETGSYVWRVYNRMVFAPSAISDLQNQVVALQEQLMSFNPGFTKNAPVTKNIRIFRGRCRQPDSVSDRIDIFCRDIAR